MLQYLLDLLVAVKQMQDQARGGSASLAAVENVHMALREMESHGDEREEALVLEVSRRELRAIEVLGGVLGVLIGVGQVLVIQFL